MEHTHSKPVAILLEGPTTPEAPDNRGIDAGDGVSNHLHNRTNIK